MLEFRNHNKPSHVEKVMAPRVDRTRGFFATATSRMVGPLVVVFLLCAVARGAEPPPSEEPPIAPINEKALWLAVGGIGSAADPGLGPWSMVSILAAGNDPSIVAWVIDSPIATHLGRARIGTTVLVGASAGPLGSYSAFAVLAAGHQYDCWTLLNTDVVTKPRGLDLVRDGIDLSKASEGELAAYWDAAILASQTSTAAFRRAARTDWTFLQLERKPRAFRGEVLYLEGRLQRTTQMFRPELGERFFLSDFYTGTVTDAGGKVYRVVFTEPPPPDGNVSFAGYFFKLQATQKSGVMPLLIGRGFQVISPPEKGLPGATASLLMACPTGARRRPLR